MAQQAQTWRWFTLPSYDLERDDLVSYLRRLFGNYEFYVRVKRSPDGNNDFFQALIVI